MNNRNNPPKNSNPTKSVHLTLDAAPDPSRARKASLREKQNDLHHFNDDGTQSSTYIMDRTGIYKNRLVATLRSNRVLIVLVILSLAALSIMPLFVPPNLPIAFKEEPFQIIAATKLENFIESKQPIAPYIRCVVKNHNLKIYLPNDPTLKAEFYKAWSDVPVSIIPILKCEDYGERCDQIKKAAIGIGEDVQVIGLEKQPAVTMEKNNYPVPFFGVAGNNNNYSPYYIAAMTDCVPEEFRLNPRPIGKSLIIPGFERAYLDIGRFFFIHTANFLAHWGFIFVILLIFLGYNKRPYSKRVEDHKHWSIK